MSEKKKSNAGRKSRENSIPDPEKAGVSEALYGVLGPKLDPETLTDAPELQPENQGEEEGPEEGPEAEEVIQPMPAKLTKGQAKRMTMIERQRHALKVFAKCLNVAETCRRVRLSRNMWESWKERYPYFREAIKNAKEGFKDFAEQIARERIALRDPIMTMFYLKTQCKDRGYIEQQEKTPQQNIGALFQIVVPEDRARELQAAIPDAEIIFRKPKQIENQNPIAIKKEEGEEEKHREEE